MAVDDRSGGDSGYGGSITGFLKNLYGEGKKTLFGDPDAVKAAYDKAIQLSQSGSADIKNFLMGQQGKAQQFYAPLQHMFNASYGTEGLQAPQAPSATGAGVGPLAQMYGGR
jgi:hypothetical protein